MHSPIAHILFVTYVNEWKIQLASEYSKDQFACEVLDGVNQNEEYKVHDDLIY